MGKHRGKGHVKSGRDASDVSTAEERQGLPRPPEAGRGARDGLSPRTSQRNQPC